MAISLRIPLAAIAGLALALPACQTTPHVRGLGVEVLVRNDRAVSGLVDIAIAPVQLGAEVKDAPRAQLRQAAQHGLTRRLYSPISFALVDRSIEGRPSVASSGVEEALPVNASYIPGDVEEDAVLEITVLRWDDRLWELRRAIDVVVEARLIDPADPHGDGLWAARIEQEYDFTKQIAIATPGLRAMQAACDQIFLELLSQMPARAVEMDEIPTVDTSKPREASATAVDAPQPVEEAPPIEEEHDLVPDPPADVEDDAEDASEEVSDDESATGEPTGEAGE